MCETPVCKHSSTVYSCMYSLERLQRSLVVAKFDFKPLKLVKGLPHHQMYILV
jgi:hypothetical protein